MNIKTTTCLLALAGTIVSSHATLIAYEGFDSAAANGKDVTTVGVTGSGFSAYGDTNYRYDTEDGLGYTDGSGNTLVTTGKSGGMEAAVSGTQNLQLALSEAIPATGTVYFSFITDVTSVTTWNFAAGLSNAEVGNSASPNAALEAAFVSTSSNWAIAGNSAGIDERTGPATGTGTFFVVSELNHDTGTMTTYLNPTDLKDIAGTTMHTITEAASGTWGAMTHFIFSLGGEEAGTIDEIRIATTLAEVAPLPGSAVEVAPPPAPAAE